jgi:transcriptional regulator with XRE-family HTH domain
VNEDVYSKLRRLISELREFAGMESREIAAEIGCAASTLSRFAGGSQEGMSYEFGVKLEQLHTSKAQLIHDNKLEKARRLMAELEAKP